MKPIEGAVYSVCWLVAASSGLGTAAGVGIAFAVVATVAAAAFCVFQMRRSNRRGPAATSSFDTSGGSPAARAVVRSPVEVPHSSAHVYVPTHVRVSMCPEPLLDDPVGAYVAPNSTVLTFSNDAARTARRSRVQERITDEQL